MRWAVEASMTRTAGFSTRATASRAASSGRQRITTSAELRRSRRAATSLRRVESIEATFRSPRPARRAWICSPVVPASPSMKTVGGIGTSLCRPKEKERLGRAEALFATLPRRAPLALRELEAASRLGLAVLLAFHDAAVAGQEAVRLENGAQAGLVVGQGLGDAVAYGAGLAGETGAFHRGDDVELAETVGNLQRLSDHHAQDRPGEIDLLVAAVDRHL